MAWYGVILLSSRLSLWDNAKENHLITGFCSTILPPLLSQLLSQGLQGCLSVVPYAVRFAGQNVWGTSALCLWKRLNYFILFLLLAWREQMKKWDSEVIPTCFSSTLPAFFTSSAQDCDEPCFQSGGQKKLQQRPTLDSCKHYSMRCSTMGWTYVNIHLVVGNEIQMEQLAATGSLEFAMSPCRLLTLRTFVILC